MARILYAWELGGGFGHVGPFHSIACELSKYGHELTLVLRDVSSVGEIYDQLDFRLFQAPTKTRRTPNVFADPRSLPQVLHNVGFADFDCLTGLVRAWHSILEVSRPDAVIVDHAPGALIALLGTEIPVVLFGIGFANPPPVHPFAAFDNCQANDEAVVAPESELLENMNRVLDANGQSRLPYVGALYESSASFLLTFKELDPYKNRVDGNYVGAWPCTSRMLTMPDWPSGSGLRIFAYLKQSRGLGHLFDWLAQEGLPSLVVCDGMDIEQLRRVAKPNLRFCKHPLPVDLVSQQCDLAILNATSSMTCSMLLAGKPILQIPHNLEQGLTAQRTAELYAGMVAPKDDGAQIVWQLIQMTQDPRFSSGASRFAEAYRDYRPAESAATVARQIHEMVTLQ